MKANPLLFLLLLSIWQPVGCHCQAAPPPVVSIIVDPQLGPAATHGLSKLKEALSSRGVNFETLTAFDAATASPLLIVGLATNRGAAMRFLADENRQMPQTPETLLITKGKRWRGQPVWLIGGSDDRGLMYGELEAAERVAWSPAQSPLAELRETLQQPSVTTRALSLYTMNRDYWESRFYDEAYWARYLDTLAQNRFNSLVVIFGYENGGFLAPCYPYFFDVEGFPDVRMVGITPEEQRRNLAALNRLIEMAHARGVELTLGIWDHIYRGGVQAGGVPGADQATQKPTPGLVWGVTADNLVPYTKAALSKFLRLVPAVDAIQFRMHDESGLKNSEQEGFWRDVFAMVKQQAPGLRLDLRAKGLPDAVIQDALNIGVNFRITTKYWMEQMGLPFHPTHINTEDQQNRRHGYADLLRYPQQYKMHWRLWNGGPARVLLWGDPEYVRRFVESTHLYDGDGFEVNEPLCTKMEAQPHDAKPFELLSPSRRYYDYEFERYWHFFQVFGRIGYNTNTPSDTWDREFVRRFGPEAGPIIKSALHRASWVLPRIVASCYPYSYFPMTRGWAEKQRLGDLPLYAKAEGSDTAQFANFDEEAQLLIAHGETAKTRPAQTSRWFSQTAMEIKTEAANAEQRIGRLRSKEFDSTTTDLKILADLALYHSRRIPAAVSYRLFVRTKAPQNLDDAIAYESKAIEAWRELVNAADDFYAGDLRMGVRSAGLCGHWKDELDALEKGLAALREQRKGLSAPAETPATVRYTTESGPGDHEPPSVIHEPVTHAPSGKPVTIAATVRDPSGVKWVRLRYRNVNQRQDYQTLPMLAGATSEQYQAVIPSDQIDTRWDLMYFIEVMDNQGNGAIFPDFNQQAPYVIVRLTR